MNKFFGIAALLAGVGMASVASAQAACPCYVTFDYDNVSCHENNGTYTLASVAYAANLEATGSATYWVGNIEPNACFEEWQNTLNYFQPHPSYVCSADLTGYGSCGSAP